MPIRLCPFTKFNSSALDKHPLLLLDISNPDTGEKLSLSVPALIDTGATDCCFPAWIAKALGHRLRAGKKKNADTGKGAATVHAHSTTIELLHPVTTKLLYTLPEIEVDYLSNLKIPLLGVNHFLSEFILNIDYPNKYFSIKSPLPPASTP